MSLLNKIFSIPSVQDRRMVGGKIKEWFYPYFSKERDDTYIYYLMMQLGFFICCAFSFIYLASYFLQARFDFIVFEIFVSREEPVRDFIYSYPFVVPTLLLLTVLPYGIILIRKYIDMDQVDLLEWNLTGARIREQNRKKFLRYFKNAPLLVLLGIYGSGALPHMMLKYVMFSSLSDSVGFLLFWCVFYSLIYSMGVTALLPSYLTYKQNKAHRGPYYRQKMIY